MDPRSLAEATAEELARFKAVVLQRVGFSMEEGREETLRMALKQRMAGMCVASYSIYHARLLADRQEFTRLVELLTVNETYFFREPEHLTLALDHLLPELRKSRQGPFRILCAGCSTGEEAYSVAIMLLERFGAECERLFSIIGVDVDEMVLTAARNGVYGSHSFRGVEPERIERHFEPQGTNQFRIKTCVRRLVSFEAANLVVTPFPQAMQLPDIIFYRNVSIYFLKPLQREIFQRLADLLPEGGYLIVGAAETLPHDVGILPLVARNGLFVFRKQTEFSIADRRAMRRDDAASFRQVPPIPLGRPRPPTPRSRTPRPEPTGFEPRRPAPGATLDLRRLFDDALELARSNRNKEALGVLEELLRQDPGFTKACSLKAAVLLGESQFAAARQACEATLDRDPLALEACLMLGVIARHEGDDESALKRFREAIYLDAACWMAHFYLAEMLLLRGEPRRARQGYESVLRILQDEALRGRCMFPLSYKAEPFMAICRHKLSQLNTNG